MQAAWHLWRWYRSISCLCLSDGCDTGNCSRNLYPFLRCKCLLTASVATQAYDTPSKMAILCSHLPLKITKCGEKGYGSIVTSSTLQFSSKRTNRMVLISLKCTKHTMTYVTWNAIVLFPSLATSLRYWVTDNATFNEAIYVILGLFRLSLTRRSRKCSIRNGHPN